MKRSLFSKIALITVILSTGICLADQALESEQIDAILKHLTDHPRITWIASGTVKASCLKYRDMNDEPVETTETYIFDGNRYYSDILINESVMASEPAGRDTKRPRYPDLKQNRHRIFCWDGEKYTRYYASGKKASVGLKQPGASNIYGPLSTGVVPWGYGIYSYEKLLSYERIGWESWDNGKQEIHLQLTRHAAEKSFILTVVLDVEKDYAVLSYVLDHPQYSIVKQNYQDYTCVNQQWVPKIVTVERFRKTSGELVLASFEDVKFESIECDVPSVDSFKVEFSAGTLVEIQPYGGMKSLLYYATDKTNIATILEDKVNLLYAEQTENCATVAARHIAKQFSRNIPQDKLNTLISNETEKTTSLYELRQVFEDAGLHCNSVQIDLGTLKRMEGGQAILHLSASNHYVILDHIDENNVWYIDLINRKFYWKQRIDDFLNEWKEGTALLVSDSPESIQVASMLLSMEKQINIRGGEYGNYACAEKIQNGGEVNCPKMIGSLCGGAYYTFYERYGCKEVDTPNSTCYGSNMPGYEYFHCIANFDLTDEGECTVIPESYIREIRACN